MLNYITILKVITKAGSKKPLFEPSLLEGNKKFTLNNYVLIKIFQDIFYVRKGIYKKK